MSDDLEISITKETLENCPPEEGASYGLLTVLAQGAYISEGIDWHIKGYRPGPLVSGYYLAEWFAGHWWRQRWEPRRENHAWAMAHRMATVGIGYVWPNITVTSDGLRVTITAEPSSRPDAKPFRYTSSKVVAFPASVWEDAVDGFIAQIVARLNAESIKATNLHKLVDDLRAERADSELSHFRRIEALLGQDPDAIPGSLVKRIIKTGESLGVGAVDEMAAQAELNGNNEPASLSASALAEVAHKEGFSASLQEGVSVATDEACSPSMTEPAWHWGVAVAERIRQQEGLSDNPLEDKRLAEMAAADVASLQDTEKTALLPAFTLAKLAGGDKVVLRAKRRSGRRFELARLLGDRLFAPADRLHPATHTYTYRQQAQRAFAAELLCPTDTTIATLNGQYEDESRREDLADLYGISPMVIQTQLVNRGVLPRSELTASQIGEVL